MDRGLDLGRNRARQHGTLSGWGPQRCAAAPTSVSSPGQLLWAVLDWLFDWLFWLPDC